MDDLGDIIIFGNTHIAANPWSKKHLLLHGFKASMGMDRDIEHWGLLGLPTCRRGNEYRIPLRYHNFQRNYPVALFKFRHFMSIYSLGFIKESVGFVIEHESCSTTSPETGILN